MDNIVGLWFSQSVSVFTITSRPLPNRILFLIFIRLMCNISLLHFLFIFWHNYFRFLDLKISIYTLGVPLPHWIDLTLPFRNTLNRFSLLWSFFPISQLFPQLIFVEFLISDRLFLLRWFPSIFPFWFIFRMFAHYEYEDA